MLNECLVCAHKLLIISNIFTYKIVSQQKTIAVNSFNSDSCRILAHLQLITGDKNLAVEFWHISVLICSEKRSRLKSGQPARLAK